MFTLEAILSVLCKSTTKQVFSSLETLGFETVYNAKGRRYAYRPGKADTSPLVVCHADTVVNGGEGPHEYAVDGSVVTSIALDDRLGIACMIEAADSGKPLGDCAMLVCDDEERGRSTASLFDTTSNPNWMVELDRRGTDVVAYQYDSTLLRSLLTSVGFTVGNGSFSDISCLEHLGVIGFNMGVGYHAEHTTRCHADLNDTLTQLGRLDLFLAKFADIRLDHYEQVDEVFDDYRRSDVELFAERNGLTYEDALYDDDVEDDDDKWRF